MMKLFLCLMNGIIHFNSNEYFLFLKPNFYTYGVQNTDSSFMKLKESDMKQISKQVENHDFFIIHIIYFNYPEGYIKFDETLIII